MSRKSALKVLAYAMTSEGGGDNCSKFVEILGLRSVFPLFMKVILLIQNIDVNKFKGHLFWPIF